MPLVKIVKLSKKGQIVLPSEIREKMGIQTGNNVVIFERDGEVVLLTPEKYSQYTRGLIKGVWGSTKEEVESYIKEERDSWK
ncbi:MAG: AbrB/MazE/SpoVT family DNA-binding domain-containing protein [Actinobacteria bacterium]|nr:AbrB/MazE/SpoVT family DNA-binding domain-containing protein [Actinomycetota bacterium]MCL6088370.1 AbrB/MazE/SpoVT family DNA-binding domain-containing protein [Actinomycetota bacterium]